MMKNIKIKWLLLLVVCAIISNCNNNDGEELLFDATIDDRIGVNKTELTDLLLSSAEGWKMLYFTKDDEFGGYTILMAFNADGTVKMTSDINGNTEAIEGKFDIGLGSTIKLNFSTYNHIHKLTDSYNPPELKGQGYKGSAEFLYYGNNENTITLRSVKGVDNEYIIMQKATAEDWESLIEENLVNQQRFIGLPTDPVYRGIKVTVNGNETIYPYTFDDVRRYINVSGKNSNGENYNTSFGIGYVSGGFVGLPALNLDNEFFTEFEYDDEAKKFISTNENGATAEFLFLDAPIVITDDYLLVNNIPDGGFDTFSYAGASLYPYLDEAIETSTRFKELFSLAIDNFKNSQGGREFNRFYVRFKEGTKEGYVQYRYLSTNGSTYSLYHFFTYDFVDKKLVLYDDGWSSTNYSASRAEALAPIDDMLFNPEGLFVEKISKRYNFSNPVFTFTSAQDTSVRFPAWTYD